MYLYLNVPQTHLFFKGRHDFLSQRSEVVAARVLRLLPLRHLLRPVVLHFIPQPRDLALQIADYVAILRDVQVTDVENVLLDLVGYLVGAIRVDQGVFALIPMHGRRRHMGDHDGTAVTAQRFLQQSRELGVAVIDVSRTTG